MKKLAVILAAALVIVLTGCGEDSKPTLITYIARGSSDSYAPHLFTLDEKTQKSTSVAIPIPTDALYVASNSDATAVVYCYDGPDGYDIFLMGKNGQEKQLTSGADACEATFSSDGKTIAYVGYSSDDDAYQIFTMNFDGSNQKALYVAPAGTVDQWMPQFSPDGKSLAFCIELMSDESAQPMRRQNGAQVSFGRQWPTRQSKNRPSKNAVRGTALALAAAPSDSGWYQMALTDTSPALVYATTTAWGPAVYSADGKKLLMTVEGDSYAAISTVNLDGTGLTPLTTGTDTEDFAPVPHRGVILFNRYNDANSSVDIYMMDQNGANQAVVNSTADTFSCLNDTYCSIG